MNIVVCVKWVISADSIVRSENGRIQNQGLCYVVNPYDLIAVEAAVRLNQSLNECEVILVCVGPPSAETGLRRCLALGADKGILVCDPACEGSDAYATALVLAAVIKHLSYGLVLCGQKSVDAGEGQVGPMLAEFLNISLVTAAAKIDFSPGGDKIVVHRKLEKGNRQVVEIGLPALVTAETGLTELRYPGLRATYAAQKKDLKMLDLRALDMNVDQVGAKGSKTQILAYQPHKPRPKKTFIPDSSLSAKDRMKSLMSGGVAQKQGDLLEGEPGYIASSVAKFLAEHKLLPKP